MADAEQPARRGYPTDAWLCAIIFGFPFAPLLMLIGLSSPKKRQRIGAKYIVWGTIIGYVALFIAILPIALLINEPSPTQPSNQTYASSTSTPAPSPTRDRKPTPKVSTDKDCLRSADCFRTRKAAYRDQARVDCWIQIEFAIANAGLIEHTRYVGGDLPTLRYFGKEPPGKNAILWLIDIEVQEGAAWEQATVECLYDHVNERVISTQVW